MDALGRAVLDTLDQGVAVFDAAGRLVYANRAARRLLEESDAADGDARRTLLARAGRPVALHDGDVALGEAVVLAANGAVGTLAERERLAILEALASTGGRLADAARRLGISRTTLWRRLRSYGGSGVPGAAS